MNKNALFWFFNVNFPIALSAIAIAFAAAIVLAIFCNKEMDGQLIVYSLVRPTEVKMRLECLQWQKEFFSLNSLHEDRLISAYFNKQGSDEEPKRKPV